jgi:hypothetical protein
VIPELEAIKSLFLHEWDPIGVADAPEAADEYDNYALRVFTMLHQGKTADDIAKYLEWVETDYMGLSATSGRGGRIADGALTIHLGHTRT